MQSALQMATAVLAGVGQIVGMRSSTEEPKFSVEAKLGDVEIRRYAERIAAETEVEGSAEAARSTGFRRLAGYIFGGNSASASIPMTAPVAQAQEPDGRWRIQFFLPSGASRESAPEPNDPAVRVIAAPAGTYAVLRFSGDRGGKAVVAREKQLLKALESSRWRAVGAPVAWFYDPPWTIPSLRRNEVAAPVAENR
jgi:hypothetical protein